MNNDKRSYTFVFVPTVKSPPKKFNIPHTTLSIILGISVVGLITISYGIFRLTQHALMAAKVQYLEHEIRQLREENQEVNSKKELLITRFMAIDSVQRNIVENSGISRQAEIGKKIGQGGPDGNTDLKDIEQATNALEAELRQIKDVFDRNLIKLSSTPNGWPVRGYITDGYGSRRNPFGRGYEQHTGLDIATNQGMSIDATADGIVIFAGVHGGYGNVVVIDHGYGITTRYAHMAQIDVTLGQHVTRGKSIGTVGSTGRSTAPHCHYEVRLHDRPVNPLNYLSVGRT
jgi:murein DD-endopeptidase MepM/ murein hydrolase activator NlpD